jgi:hypothetical protein
LKKDEEEDYSGVEDMHAIEDRCRGPRPIVASLLKDAPSQYSM